MLVIVASDRNGEVGALSSSATVKVTIIPVNEFTPIFTSSFYNVSVAENTTVGSIILTLDADDNDRGTDGMVVFLMSTHSLFLISAQTGDLFLKSKLDFETERNYTIEVIAKDESLSSPRSSSAIVFIMVTDVNDNHPHCTSTVYSVTMNESVTVGTHILSILCSDNDITSKLSYNIISGNSGSGFEVIATSGILYTVKSLDSEVTSIYSLVVKVSDEDFFVNVSVVVEVVDENDNSPFFVPDGPYNVTLTENLEISSVVYDVNATDLDVSNSDLSFSIIEGNANSIFRISHSTGIIQLHSQLDFETTKLYVLLLEVSDGLFSSTTTLSIVITDVNDNKPSCDQATYTATVNESVHTNFPVLSISCSDVDTVSEILSYKIPSGNEGGVFAMGNDTGKIVIRSSLDFETRSIYALQVVVSDNGMPEMTTRLDVNIAVTPINEFAPSFDMSCGGEVEVTESISVGTAVINVTAYDNDTGLDHGTIRYSITSGNSYGYFAIDEYDGTVRVVKSLDREYISFFSLEITAEDCTEGSTESLSSVLIINVTVLDVNDNFPEFSPVLYTTKISETAVVDSILIRVYATDDDEGKSGTEGLVYSIASGNEDYVFRMIRNAIILANSLNFDSIPSYKLTIRVADQGTPVLSAYAYVNIEILPVNEYSPEFVTSNVSLVVSESTPVGTTLCSVFANDSDTGYHGNVRYYITSWNEIANSTFFLNEFSGDLVLWSPLDFDTLPSVYNITIEAKDNPLSSSDSNKASISITIMVTDENDEIPRFTRNIYTAFVAEDVVPGTAVLQVTADDADSGTNGLVTYNSVSGDGESFFNINPQNGIISTKVPLDYETKSSFSLIVTANDGGTPISLSSRCLVKLTVTDVNDNSPVFVHSKFSVNISESSPIGTIVTQLSAQDEDSQSNSNNVVTYSIISSLFQIDPASGLLKTISTLDRETMEK